MELKDFDFLKGARLEVSERIFNPIVFSFIFSWCLVNYRVLLVVFSGESFFEKMSYIDSYFSLISWSENPIYACLTLAVGYPLIGSVFYLYAVPWVSRWAGVFNERLRVDYHNAMKQERYKKVLTERESLKLNLKLENNSNELASKITGYETDISELRQKLEESAVSAAEQEVRCKSLEVSSLTTGGVSYRLGVGYLKQRLDLFRGQQFSVSDLMEDDPFFTAQHELKRAFVDIWTGYIKEGIFENLVPVKGTGYFEFVPTADEKVERLADEILTGFKNKPGSFTVFAKDLEGHYNGRLDEYTLAIQHLLKSDFLGSYKDHGTGELVYSIHHPGRKRLMELEALYGGDE